MAMMLGVSSGMICQLFLDSLLLISRMVCDHLGFEWWLVGYITSQNRRRLEAFVSPTALRNVLGCM